MSTQALVKQVKTVEEMLMDRVSIERFRSGIGELERFMTAEKLARVALTAVLNNSDLLECDPRTILAATLQLGQVGLLPDGFLGQAYLIPYDNTVNNVKVMQATPMIGYRGFGELIARSGKANSHDAQVVYSNDEFDFAMGSEPYIRHVRKLGKRGEPVGAYAIVYMKEGPPRFDIMDMEELDKIRKSSRGASRSSSPWNKWTEEMYRKSPVRRLAKYVPLSSEFQRASTIDEGAELGYTKFDEKRSEYVMDNHGAKEEKAAVMQPQRVQTGSGPIIVGERQACSVCGKPVESLKAGGYGHTESGEYDHKAVLAESLTAEVPIAAGAAQAEAQAGDPAADANPFTKEEGMRELTYEKVADEVKPDTYHKDQNPNGKHISQAQHGRIWAILHAAQEKAKADGSKVLTDDEFKAHVKALGYPTTQFIPKAPKDIYDGIAAFAGGESLKMNGGK